MRTPPLLRGRRNDRVNAGHRRGGGARPRGSRSVGAGKRLRRGRLRESERDAGLTRSIGFSPIVTARRTERWSWECSSRSLRRSVPTSPFFAVLAPPIRVRHPLRSATDLLSSRWFAVGWMVAILAWGLHVGALARAPVGRAGRPLRRTRVLRLPPWAFGHLV